MVERKTPHIDNVYWGGDVTEGLRVDDLADRIKDERILNPISGTDVRERNKRGICILRSLSELGVDSVRGLMRKTDEGNDEEKEEAELVLKRLAGAVYLLARSGVTKRLQNALGEGSAMDIDEALPKVFEGLGERVVGNIISNDEIRNVVDSLDKVREGEGWELIPPENEEYLTVLDEHMRRLARLGSVIPEGHDDRNQLEMVIAHWSAIRESIKEGVLQGRDDVNRKSGVDVDRSWRGGGVGETGGIGDDVSRFGSPENLGRAVQRLSIDRNALSELMKAETKEELELWVADQVMDAVQNPLFVANWWQGGYSETLWKIVAEKKGFEKRSEDERGIRDYSRAVCAVFGMGEADRNVDDTATGLIQFNPPKNMIKEFMWSQKKFELLKDHPYIGFFIQEIYNVGFEKGEGAEGYEGQGWRIVKAFTSEESRDSLDDFCDWMIDNLEENDRWGKHCEDKSISLEAEEYRSLHSFVRIALEQFEVDYMPELIRLWHSNKLAERSRRNRQLDWFKWVPGDLGTKKGAWDSSMKFEAPDGSEGEIPYNHPRMMRPHDLLLAKGSYVNNPRLVANFGRVTQALMARRFRDKNGRMVPCRGADQLDKYNKWAQFLELIRGKGVQGGGIDDLIDFGDAIKAAVNYWGADDYLKERGLRDLLAEMFAIKVDAIFWKGYKSGSKSVLADLQRLDPTYSSEDERRKAIGGLLGGTKTGLRGNYGGFADGQRMFDMDLFSLEGGNDIARDAMVRLLMDEPDVIKAWEAYAKGDMVLLAKVGLGVGEVIGAVLGEGRR